VRYDHGIATIPHRELRNASGAILRRAESGEEFTITVDGRPVATLGPYRRREWVPREAVEELLATPTDERLLEDVAGPLDDDPRDPWTR
jgi:prevent-host-death family protein